MLAHYYGTEVADGFFHSFSGWVIYIAAFLLLFGVGWILDRFRPAYDKAPLRHPRVRKKALTAERGASVAAPGTAATPAVQVEGTE